MSTYKNIDMKRTIVLRFLFFTVLALFSSVVYSQSNGYVNLGLPSGTLWKDQNENGFYDYSSAVQKYGRMLPTKAQAEELKTKCRWTWTGNGFKIVGPNGKSIYLPACGCIHCDGSYNEVSCGYYWTCTPDDSEAAWTLDFMLSSVLGPRVYIGDTFRCVHGTIRLVK